MPVVLPQDSSVSDRYPIGSTDRTPIAPSRPDQVSGPVVSHLQVADARGTDDGLTEISAALARKAGRIVTPDEARHAAGVVLTRAERSGKPVLRPVPYVLQAIADEPDVYVLLLGEPPDLGDIIGGHGTARLPGQHPFKPDGSGATCEICGLRESNQRHQEAS